MAPNLTVCHAVVCPRQRGRPDCAGDRGMSDFRCQICGRNKPLRQSSMGPQCPGTERHECWKRTRQVATFLRLDLLDPETLTGKDQSTDTGPCK